MNYHRRNQTPAIWLRAILSALATLPLLFVAWGCSNPNQPVQTPQSLSTINRRSPVKLVILQDKSGSANQTRTEQLKPTDFTPLIECLRNTGGELGFGLISDDSNRPLLRLHIDDRPVVPTPPSGQGNPFQAAQRMADYRRQHARHKADIQRWHDRTDLQVNTFMMALKRLLEQPANAKRTDIWSAVSRADLFLAETDTTRRLPTHRYALFVTDGEDNVNAPSVPMRSGATVIIINGAARVGSMASLNPLRFESVTAAFRHIIAVEQGKGP